jgi:mono/diheme cytochrome c family protein
MNASTRRSFLLLVALALPTPLLAQLDHPATDAEADAQGMLGTVDGGRIYAEICEGCHMADGRGAFGAGHYPALAGNPAMASANYVATLILAGRRNMPSFARPMHDEFFFAATWLTDPQVANVVNHVRTHFGNHFEPPITPTEVAALRPPAQGD